MPEGMLDLLTDRSSSYYVNKIIFITNCQLDTLLLNKYFKFWFFIFFLPNINLFCFFQCVKKNKDYLKDKKYFENMMDSKSDIKKIIDRADQLSKSLEIRWVK